MALLRTRTRGAILCLCAAVFPGSASSQALTQDEALALAFSGADLERRTAFLDDPDLALANRLAGPDVDVESGVVSYYVASRGGVAVGVAYFDAHRVRTLPQVLMIVVDAEGQVARVETVSWREPPEYRPPAGWLRQFDARGLDDALSLRGEIATITGATLTAGASTRATRRVLALHQVIDPLAEGTP